MATAVAGVLNWCPCPFGAGVKKGGSSMAAIVPWSKMMTRLRFVADPTAAGVFSQDSGLTTQSSGDLLMCYGCLRNAGKNIPLSKQVRYFASTKAEMEAAWGSRKVSTLLTKSFFLLSIGSNDLFQSNPKNPADVAALYATLVSNYTAAIVDLYGMGVRKFGIVNMGPVGCVPRVRVLNMTRACNDGINRMAVGFAAAVKSGLEALAPTLPGFAYSLADSFAATQATFANPQPLGFKNVDSACCGIGRLGAEDGLCKRNSTLCADRDTYMFFDAVHSTQRAAELLAQRMFDGPAQLTEPISFKQLAQKRY